MKCETDSSEVALKVSSGALARVTLGVIFLYHGLVPKILFLSATEVQMIQAHGAALPYRELAFAGGVAEVILGLALVLLQRQLWPVWLALVALVLLLVDVALFAPSLLVEAFNPVSTNLAGISLCIIAIAQSRERVQRSCSGEQP